MSRSQKNSLAGKRIVITRPQGQTTPLRDALEKQGASVLELPLLSIEYLSASETSKEIFEEMGQYDWLVFTSANGVHGFFNQFFASFKDIRGIGLCRIGCVGPATARAVENYHLQVDVLPEEHTGEALAQKMVGEHHLEHLRLLLVTGNRNRENVLTILTEQGQAIVDVLPVYETQENDVAQLDAAEEFRRNGADAIIFASPSAVEAFLSQARQLKLSPQATQPRAVAIGSVTATAMKNAGIPVAAQAGEATPTALAQALTQALAK